MATLRNLTVVVEVSGNRIPIEEVEGSMKASELLQALAGRINLPHNTKGVLIRKVTRKQILPNQSLDDAGVGSGETLLADFERTAGV